MYARIREVWPSAPLQRFHELVATMTETGIVDEFCTVLCDMTLRATLQDSMQQAEGLYYTLSVTKQKEYTRRMWRLYRQMSECMSMTFDLARCCDMIEACQVLRAELFADVRDAEAAASAVEDGDEHTYELLTAVVGDRGMLQLVRRYIAAQQAGEESDIVQRLIQWTKERAAIERQRDQLQQRENELVAAYSAEMRQIEHRRRGLRQREMADNIRLRS
jgi:hypothetical protein